MERIPVTYTPDRKVNGITPQSQFCPKCGQNHLYYGQIQRDSEVYMTIEWTCVSCGAEGEEQLNTDFIAHVVYEEPIPVEPTDLQASEREILLANVLDYFSDLKEAQIEAMIPNLIKFISGRDPKNSVVINEDADGTFSIYEESGQCIEFGFESKDEAKDYAVDNHMVVVDNFNL